MKALSRALFSSFQIKPSKTRVSIVTFGNEVDQAATLTESKNAKNLADTLDRITKMGGQSRLNKLLENADYFKPQNGGRRDSGKVLVILTKKSRGVAINDLSYLSGILQNQGIKVVVVGIDFDQVNDNQLRAVTGNPKDTIPINGIDNLRSKFGDIEDKISSALGKERSFLK